MKIFYFLILTLLLSSCAKQYLDIIERGAEEPVKSNYLETYSDYNIFRYQRNVGMARDTEKIYPRHFDVRLPRKIVHWEIINITEFGFYYDDKQVVFIKLKLENATSKPDSIYTPGRDELFMCVGEGVLTSRDEKYDIRKIKLLPRRKNLVIDKGDALIILYNIKADALNTFLNNTKAFKFLN